MYFVFVSETDELFTKMILKDYSSLNMQGDMSQRSTSQGGISQTDGRAKTQNDRQLSQFESLAYGHIMLTIMLLVLRRPAIVYFMIVGYLIWMALLFLKGKISFDKYVTYNSYQMATYRMQILVSQYE